MGLLEQQHLRAVLGGGERGHRSCGAATDDEHVAVEPDGVVECGDAAIIADQLRMIQCGNHFSAQRGSR